MLLDRFAGTGLQVFSQRRDWALLSSLADVPVSGKVGGVLISAKPEMP